MKDLRKFCAAGLAASMFLGSLCGCTTSSGSSAVDDAINPNNPFGLTEDAYYITFNVDNINDDMPIGLDSNGDLIMSSNIISIGGADYYQEVYDSNSANLSVFFEEAKINEN